MKPTIIVVHTAENIPDFNPPDRGAESIANYFANTSRPVSCHSVVDSDSNIPLLPDEAVAFHVRGYNTPGWGIEIATQAAAWDRIPAWHKEALLDAAAKECARVAEKFNIPIVFRDARQIVAGLPGFTGHTNLDPTRRSDPGFDTNDWADFLARVKSYTQPKEDEMSLYPMEQGDGMGAREFKKSDVAYEQSRYNFVFTPAVPLVEDGRYGPKSTEAFANIPGAPTPANSPKGSLFTGKMGKELDILVAQKANESVHKNFGVALSSVTRDIDDLQEQCSTGSSGYVEHTHKTDGGTPT